MENFAREFDLPGFRFHPTEEELVDYYLKETVLGKIVHSDVIGFLNIYKHDPWDLPGMAKFGEREWYFFVHRDRRTGHGGKPNRITEKGYWKATGSDHDVRCIKEPRKIMGTRKTLVFYTGKAPKGSRTDWVMNEYRLISNTSFPIAEDIVLCKIFRRATPLKVLEQRAEELARTSYVAQINFNTPLSLPDLDYGAVRREELEAAAQRLESHKEADFEPLATVGSMKEKLQQAELSMDWTLNSIFSNAMW